MVAKADRFGAEDVREIGSNRGPRLFKEAMAAEQADEAGGLACHAPGVTSGRPGSDLAGGPGSRQSSPQLIRVR
jgi:hypothetical protein